MASGMITIQRTFAIVALLGTLTRPAAADPAAEQLFREGKQLLHDGHLDHACDKFAASQALEPRVGTLLNLGECRERQGRIATAWEVFLHAKALASRDQDARADEAGRRADALAPHRAFLTLVVPVGSRVPSLVITRDDVEVPSSVWSAAVPIDPGRYTIVARAPGHQPRTTIVEVAREGRAIATIDALIVVPPPPPPMTRAIASPPVVDDHAVEPTAPAAAAPRRVMLGFGPVLGLSSDGDPIGGGRLIVARPIAGAELRGSLAMKYANYLNDTGDPGDFTARRSFGLGLDYVRLAPHGLAAAVGLGAGLDRFKWVYENPSTTVAWISLRASPLVVRLASPKLEVGLHLEYVRATILEGTRIAPVRPSSTALIGLDWFIW